MGPGGRKFIFEMDAVMGGLLGIPHYSKLEAVMLGFRGLAAFLLWSRNPVVQLVAILGLMVADLYLLICVAYGRNARQPIIPSFIIIMAPVTGIIIWCCVSFLSPVYYITLIVVTIVGIILSIACHFIMRIRKDKLEPKIKFQKDQKEKNPDWKMQWRRGKDAPEGFEEATE